MENYAFFYQPAEERQQAHEKRVALAAQRRKIAFWGAAGALGAMTIGLGSWLYNKLK